MVGERFIWDERQDLPTERYVALYGSKSPAWRTRAKAALDRANIPWFDPSDQRWRTITDETGDAQQEEIDGIVAHQHRGLRDAYSTIFVVECWETDGTKALSLASRYELGLLTALGARVYLYVEPGTMGRNYLWAACRASGRANIRFFDDIDEAIRAAVADYLCP